MVECPFCGLLKEGLPAHTIYEDETFFVMLNRESLGLGPLYGHSPPARRQNL